MNDSVLAQEAKSTTDMAVTAILPAAPVAVSTAPKLSPLQVSGRLATLYRTVRTSFWRAENALVARAFDEEIDLNRSERMSFFAKPIAKNDSLVADYNRAANASDNYIALATKGDRAARELAAVIYLGAVAHYTLGNHVRALELFEQLQQQFPSYKRDQYINDRSDPDPKYSAPVRAGIAKLIVQLRLQTLPKDPPDAWAALQQITNEALAALSFQREYAVWIAAQSDKYNTRRFEESSFGSEPHQRRASALPRTLDLIEAAWDALLEKALPHAGAGTLRGWLRTLAAPGAVLEKPALLRLTTIDGLIIKQYFAEAQTLLNEKNFDGARGKYQQIMAEYQDSDAAQQAAAALPGIKPLAIAHYKSEGEKNFQPHNKLGVPQTQSREYFEKLLREDPDSESGAYFYARALATENKTDQALAQLQQLAAKHPKGDLSASALYLQGFLLAGNKKPDYDKAVALMDKVAAEHGSSAEAPEALFHAGMYLAWQNRFPEAIERLQKIEAYPASVRHKWAILWVKRLQQKIQEGTQWP
ncbi:MAG: tetratricopeptide repeat protein [Glaciimonas sp.]|nr:tetratricopeptide repeat protein [Glaciimonas sp.]